MSKRLAAGLIVSALAGATTVVGIGGTGASTGLFQAIAYCKDGNAIFGEVVDNGATSNASCANDKGEDGWNAGVVY
jgi:hypothetical protein